MNNILDFPQNQILTGERLYAEVINIILASAQHQLLIFDQDLSHVDFASLEKYALIQQFLSKNITSRLTIILQSTTFFTEKCPRLFDLLALYGHKMTVHETSEAAKHAKTALYWRMLSITSNVFISIKRALNTHLMMKIVWKCSTHDSKSYLKPHKM